MSRAVQKSLAIAFLLLSPQMVLAGNACVTLFAPVPAETVQVRVEQVEAIGSLKKDFVLDPHYKVEVPNQSEIKNQCHLGTCTLHSWASMLEHDYKSSTGKEMKVSAHYLSAIHWLRESLMMLAPNPRPGTENQIDVNLGANIFASRGSIVMSGIVPDIAWEGSRDFQMAPLSLRITEYVKNITARAKLEMSQQKDSKKVELIREKASKDILATFLKLIGNIPQRFVYEGTLYTPHSFQKTFFPELDKPLTWVMEGEKTPRTRLDFEFAQGTMVSSNIETIESTARKLLDNGQNVFLGYDHNPHFVDTKTGIMSISAFNMPAGAEPLTKEQRLFYKMPFGGHAVQIVGYDVDPTTNGVTKWKIKNSWGDKAGDAGYYHMYSDYFRAFVMGVGFYSDSKYAPKIEQKMPQQMQLNFDAPPSPAAGAGSGAGDPVGKILNDLLNQ